MVKNKWYIGGLHFACQQCGKCCSGPQEGVIWISRPEIQLLADYLNLSVSELRKKLLKRTGFRRSIRENPCSKDCVFLAELNGFKGCTIYDVRPMQCRNWPFWPANLTSPDDWNMAAVKCPGINPAPIVPGPNQKKNDSTGVERSGFDFAATRNNRCGVNKGRLYTFDEIQKIKKQKHWWTCLAAAGTAATQSRDSNGAVILKICEEVAKIYDWLDENLKSFNNQCSACGKCCNFDSFGHKLFVTTPELLYFKQNVKNSKPMSTQTCPYLEDTPPHQFTLRRISLKEHLKPIGLAFKTLHRSVNWCGGKCTARNYRFAGCRIFFCKANKDFQNKLSEETVKKFKSLCDKFDFPYRYVDLSTALNNPELAKIAVGQ